MIEIIPNWHPVFVHFSVALLVIAALFHLLVHFSKNDNVIQQLTIVANWNLWLGALFSLFTVVAGWFAFNSVNHDTPSHLAMLDHRNWALVTVAVVVIIAIWSITQAKKSAAIGWPITIALVIAAILLGSTAWRGGELVYRYGLGVMSLPKADEHGHSDGHDHSHDSTDMAPSTDSHGHDEHEHAANIAAPDSPDPSAHDPSGHDDGEIKAEPEAPAAHDHSDHDHSH